MVIAFGSDFLNAFRPDPLDRATVMSPPDCGVCVHVFGCWTPILIGTVVVLLILNLAFFLWRG